MKWLVPAPKVRAYPFDTDACVTDAERAGGTSADSSHEDAGVDAEDGSSMEGPWPTIGSSICRRETSCPVCLR